MTCALALFSEPFAATGNMHGEGFRRLLGRPDLSLLQTVIREALQNCVDAATASEGPSILLRARTLKAEERAALRELVLSELPYSPTSSDALQSALRKRHLRVFEICDFQTIGLAGPTRADLPARGDEPHNFVNFLRNVGASRDTHHGGGTYGYGKTSLYALSSCATILTDSLTTDEGNQVRRLMGCHLGEAFEAPDHGTSRRFTGRHWWGGEMLDGNLEPVTGEHAKRVAEALGLPARPVRSTGTSIAIIDPMFESEDMLATADELVETVLWNFWPRMARSTPSNRRLNVTLEVDGQKIAIPAPEEFPPLDLFCQALELQRNGEQQSPIRCGRPVATLGHLVVSKGLTARRVGAATRTHSLIPTPSSHIALMRPVELVVKYLRGEPFADPRYEWAGVFVCSDKDEIEAAFADAEPPAHDDWIPANLPKGDAKTYVNVALTRLKEQARLVAQPSGVIAKGGDAGPSLASTATKMGHLLVGTSSGGPGRSRVPARPSAPRKGTAISRPTFKMLEAGNHGQAIAVFEAELRNDGTYPGLRLVAEPHLVADGGRTDAHDLPGEYRVDLVELSLPSAGLSTEWKTLPVGHHAGLVRISVRAPAAAAAGVNIRLQWDETDP